MNKVYLAVDSYGTETMSNIPPIRGNVSWVILYGAAYNQIKLPTGTIRRLIGRDLTWEDELVEFTCEMLKTE